MEVSYNIYLFNIILKALGPNFTSLMKQIPSMSFKLSTVLKIFIALVI